MKLSERAKSLLMLIDQNTERNPDGELKRFWVPSAYTQYFYIGKELSEIWVQGSGDANALKGLERKGLIKRPNTQLPNKFVYAITEDGRLAIEQMQERGTLPAVCRI